MGQAALPPLLEKSARRDGRRQERDHHHEKDDHLDHPVRRGVGGEDLFDDADRRRHDDRYRVVRESGDRRRGEAADEEFGAERLGRHDPTRRDDQTHRERRQSARDRPGEDGHVASGDSGGVGGFAVRRRRPDRHADPRTPQEEAEGDQYERAEDPLRAERRGDEQRSDLTGRQSDRLGEVEA